MLYLPACDADATPVRGSLVLKLISVVVLLVLTVLGARAFTASSPSSPLNPLNVARNGLSGICANQQATADAGGSDPSAPPATAISPSEQSQLQATDPAAWRALEGAAGGSPVCPTTTTSP